MPLPVNWPRPKGRAGWLATQSGRSENGRWMMATPRCKLKGSKDTDRIGGGSEAETRIVSVNFIAVRAKFQLEIGRLPISEYVGLSAAISAH